MGKDQLFFPIKEVAPRTYALTQFLCEGFSMCLSKRSELRHIDPKACDNPASLSKRRYDSLEKEF